MKKIINGLKSWFYFQMARALVVWNIFQLRPREFDGQQISEKINLKYDIQNHIHIWPKYTNMWYSLNIFTYIFK